MVKLAKQKLLKDADEIFNKHNIHYFLLYGTVLGMYREKRILPWDGDIDLGIFVESYDAMLGCKKDFEKKGYSFIQKVQYGRIFICDKKDAVYYTDTKKDTWPHVPWHISISYFTKDWDNAVEIQLFNNDLFQRWFGRKNWLYTLFTLLRVKHEVYPLNWFENLNYINGFPVPSCTDKYLKYVYGKNWRIPDSKWTRKKHFQHQSAIRHYIIKERKNRKIYYAHKLGVKGK